MPKCQIVAQFWYPDCSENIFNPRNPKSEQDDQRLTKLEQNSKVKIKYFDLNDLKDFLNGNLNITAGILQRFTDPGQEYNSN